SSVPDASSRACSGASRVPKTSWPCVVSTPAVDSTRFGKTGSTPTPPATTASPSQRNGRILSYALGKMLPIFRLGLGGKLGYGRQYWSWIAIDDLLAIIHYVLTSDTLAGPVNVVSPHAITN